MIFVEKDASFEFNGRKYVCKQEPKHFWPCQSCALSEVCCEMRDSDNFPECRKEHRKDKTAVVFYEDTSRAPIRPPRSRR